MTQTGSVCVWGRAWDQALHLCHARGSYDSLWTLHQANLRPKSHSQVTSREQVQWGQRGSLHMCIGHILKKQYTMGSFVGKHLLTARPPVLQASRGMTVGCRFLWC